MSAPSDKPPVEFPQPVISEPSAFRIMDFLQNLMSAWTSMLKRMDVYELADEFTGLDLEQKLNLDRKLLSIRPEYRGQFQAMGQDLRPYRVWERFRETYEPHPALTGALMAMKSGTKIPGSVFQRLPHINPVFLLTAAPRITMPEGSTGRIIALFISGAVSRRDQQETDTAKLGDDAPGHAPVLLDTNDPHANAYHVMAVTEVLDSTGTQVVDVDFCHLTLPLRREFTLDGLARATADGGFGWQLVEETSEDTRYTYLMDVSRAAISHLLYACSRTVEVDDKPRASRPPAKRKKGQPKPPAAAKVRRMGWRLGAAVQDSIRRFADQERSTATGTGPKLAPHLRAAHMHTYLVGPGRQEIDIKWLDPIPVNAGKDDGTTITRHRVK